MLCEGKVVGLRQAARLGVEGTSEGFHLIGQLAFGFLFSGYIILIVTFHLPPHSGYNSDDEIKLTVV